MKEPVMEKRIELSALTIVRLVRLAQQGHRDAFGELSERYRQALTARAKRRLRDADEADELVQEAFLQAMEKLPQLRSPEAFGSWLYRIVDRMAINRLTRRRPDLATDPETIEATCVGMNTPEATAVRRESVAHVNAAVNRLGELDRETLHAFYMRGQSLIEMSEAFDAPVGTIKRRLHVARKRLAKEMDVAQAV